MLVFNFDINNTITKIGRKYKGMKIELFPSFMKIFEVYPECRIVFRTYGRNRLDLLKEFINYDFIQLKTDWKNGDSPTYVDDYGEVVDINNLLLTTDTKTIIFINEDYHKWAGEKYNPKFGKIINGNDKLLQMGFDDKDCMYTEDLNVKLHMVDVDKASTDENYYIDLICVMSDDVES